jgi:hypothetical protein
MRTQLVVLTVVGLSVAGCGNPGSSPTDTSMGAPQSRSAPAAESSASAPVDPCTGIAGCREVAPVDVDGDGTADRVGISIYQAPPPPQVVYGDTTITMSIAVGPHVQRIDVKSSGDLPVKDGSRQPYVGAYRISRKTGADLVLHTLRGQGQAEQFAVIGWQGGQPKLVNRPPRDANAQATDVWAMGSSHGVHEWVVCADGAAVTMHKLSAPIAEGIPIPGGGIHEENAFVFDSGAWSANGSKNVADDNFSYDFDPHTQTFLCEDQAQH